MAAGIIYTTSILSTIALAIISIIAVLIVREHKVLLVVTLIFYAIMIATELERGRIENAIVEGVLDAALLIIALKPWKRQTGGG